MEASFLQVFYLISAFCSSFSLWVNIYKFARLHDFELALLMKLPWLLDIHIHQKTPRNVASYLYSSFYILMILIFIFICIF